MQDNFSLDWGDEAGGGAVLALGMQGKEKKKGFLLSWTSQSGGERQVHMQVPWKVVTKMVHMWSGRRSQDWRKQLSVETELMRATGPGGIALSEGTEFQAWSVTE